MTSGDAVADGKWQPDAAVVRQQQGGSEGRYTIFRQALEVTDHDLEDGRERARTEGKSIFNPDLKRFQAALAPEHDLVCRVVRKLEELGWLSDGRTPSRYAQVHCLTVALTMQRHVRRRQDRPRTPSTRASSCRRS